MELIFYDEAASLLGVKVNTINQAIERGILTRAGRNGRNMLLIKEQVMLFTGINQRTGNKKRLSLLALSKGEYSQWQNYQKQGLQTFKEQATKRQMYSPPAPQREEIKAIVQAEVDQREEQLGEAFASFLMQMGVLFKTEVMPRVKNEAQKSEVPQGINFTMAS